MFVCLNGWMPYQKRKVDIPSSGILPQIQGLSIDGNIPFQGNPGTEKTFLPLPVQS